MCNCTSGVGFNLWFLYSVKPPSQQQYLDTVTWHVINVKMTEAVSKTACCRLFHSLCKMTGLCANNAKTWTTRPPSNRKFSPKDVFLMFNHPRFQDIRVTTEEDWNSWLLFLRGVIFQTYFFKKIFKGIFFIQS